MKVRTPDGSRLAVEVSGPDRPAATIVLAHGWTMTRTSWHPVIELVHRVRPDVAVVVYDHREHGDSSAAPQVVDVAGQPSMEVLADDLRAVVEQVVPEGPLVLAGHSMGGMAVLALAGSDPGLIDSRVVGVGLVSTAAGGLRRRRALTAAMRVLETSPARLRVPRVPAPVARRIGYGSEAGADLVAQVRRGVRPPLARSVGRWYRALMSHQVDPVCLRRTRVAVLVGERDRLTPPQHSHEIADALPGATFSVLPGAGHMLPFERPQAVADALLDLLPSARPAR